MLRTGGIIYSERIDRPKFCPSRVSRRHRRNDAHFLGRLIFRRTRHININSMYEICQNEFRLGAAGPPDHHFSSRGECDLDVKYRCIIARAREEYQVGRFPLSRFFRIIRSSAGTDASLRVTRNTIASICCLLFVIFSYFRDGVMCARFIGFYYLCSEFTEMKK